jgi:hypothetical protein
VPTSTMLVVFSLSLSHFCPFQSRAHRYSEQGLSLDFPPPPKIKSNCYFLACCKSFDRSSGSTWFTFPFLFLHRWWSHNFKLWITWLRCNFFFKKWRCYRDWEETKSTGRTEFNGFIFPNSIIKGYVRDHDKKFLLNNNFFIFNISILKRLKNIKKINLK